jgi:hypothetical protein
MIITALHLPPDVLIRWTSDGSVNIGGLFEYWKWEDNAVQNIAGLDFEMYRWHLRMIDGRSNRGWMRNMMYSLTQQLVRQDPGYWLVYTLLRSDHSYRLTSYPYYTKSQQPGDPTAFRHIDHNIESMAAGRGVRQIQGSLSLDDEYADDCTEIVPGMHRHLLDWCSTLHQRGLASYGYIQAIEGDTLTEEDLEKYGTR